ncbi:MAG TPA: DUF6602 domain-containing protein [Bryobacteraceae bacterium]|jgi:hypothetical protein|nr:DUF6602 domain-containing protein [Bryobacteraceae bacterium]
MNEHETPTGLHNQAKRIDADLANSNLFNQNGDRGDFREAIIRQFLRPFLPRCYGLSTGEVFASDASQSAQIDIVVYDAVFSTVLFEGYPVSLFPAESVFGSIEVKSNLTKDELQIACDNVASLKRLPREQSDLLQFSLQIHFDVDSRTFGYDKRSRNPYMGVVFGYRGATVETIGAELDRRLRERPDEKMLLPDYVFVADRGYVFLRWNDSGAVPPGGPFSRFAYLEIGQDVLPFFFVTVNAFLSQLRLKGINFTDLWSQYFGELLARAQAVPKI